MTIELLNASRNAPTGRGDDRTLTIIKSNWRIEMNEYLKSFEFNSMLALFVYWIPLAICLSVYFFRTIKIYKQDLSQCTRERYDPELTIGLIVWYLLISIIPAVNLFALVFEKKYLNIVSNISFQGYVVFFFEKQKFY